MPETKLAVLAEVWFDQISRVGLSPSTILAYRDRLDRQILPAMADVRVRELNTGLVDHHSSSHCG
jgi:hypothetical protein